LVQNRTVCTAKSVPTAARRALSSGTDREPAAWPDGHLGFIGRLLLGRTSREIDATELIWAFAMEHSEA
jgi:poly(3-hydroxybutyrate) depolymerase